MSPSLSPASSTMPLFCLQAAKTPKREADHDHGDGSSSGRALSASSGTKHEAYPAEDGGAVQALSLGDEASALDTALDSASSARSGSALLLSKWLESAARYQPSPAPANAKHCQKLPAGWGIASAWLDLPVTSPEAGEERAARH